MQILTRIRAYTYIKQLLDLVVKLVLNYKNSIGQVPLNEEVYSNQILLAVAIMVLDYPSRLDKFEMDIITDNANSEKLRIDDNVITSGYIFAGGSTTGLRINGNDYGNTIYQNATTIGGNPANIGFTLS